jgi:type VI protein secretion system component VasK
MADAVARMNADPRAGAAGVDAAARDGQTFVRDLALTFPADPLPFEEASEGLRVLLAAPFLAGGEIAAGGPRRAASLAAEEFCRVWRPSLFDKYPFRSDAVTDATIDDLNSLLNPQTGAYRKFIETIEGLQVTPSTDYTNFKTMADRVANALYQPGASAPALRFGLRMENLVGSQRVDVAVGTRIYQFAINRQELELVAWEPRSQVTVTVQTGVPSRPTEELQLGADPWKLFRFFRQSDWNEVRAGLYRVSWPPVAGVDMLAEVQMPVPVLDPDYLRNFTCPRQVAR